MPRSFRAAPAGAALVALVLAALLSGASAGRPIPRASQTGLQKALSKYYSNAELFSHMRDFATRCSHIAKLHDPIGSSVRNEPLLVLEISNKPGVEEAKPNFKYIANMHGDETGGRQLLLALAEWLCEKYQSDATARNMVDNLHTFLMPTMNPDGYAARTRGNANGVDLNRNFPDPIDNPYMVPTGQEQPETVAVMNWVQSRQFTASANMHEGALVVNYPWDGTKSRRREYNATQDDGTFHYISRVYAQNNPQLKDGSSSFRDGTTNGAAWYPIYGGMQDWNYVKAGCFEVTLELWSQKGKASLQTLFDNNLASMIAYATRSTLGGLRGTVKTAAGQKPLAAIITVDGSDFVTRTGKFGEFFRPLAPGSYTARVVVPGSAERTFDITVPTTGAGVSLSVVI